MTRDAASRKAQALTRLGAQVVEASLTDEGSRRGLEAARVFNPHPLSLTDFPTAHRAEFADPEELR